MKMRLASSSHIGSYSALLLLALLLSAALLFTFSADSSTAEAQEEDSPRLAGPSPRIINSPSVGQTYRRGEVIQVQAGSASTRFGLDDANTVAPTLVTVHAGDRAVLVAFYNATGGPDWTDKYNWLSDEHPGEWQGVTTDDDGRVTHLVLWDNNLTGAIPAQLSDLTRLQELDLAANQLTGSIPSALGNLSNLTVLDLDTNQLSGSLPSELGNLSNLRKLAISENGLSGALPAELGNLSNLAELYLWGNEFSGEIPSELGSLSNLRELSLQDNQLTGAIPPELGRLGNLEHLGLWGNQLTGSIPPELGNLSSLRELWLENNQLTGAIPAQLGNLSNLTELNLWENQLTGTIPSELGSLPHLEDLLFAGNDLTGEIPPELGNLATLELLSLSRNNLTGEIPSELGNLDNLRGLWLYDNELIGAIPPELGSLSNLKYLVLSDNRLTGAIPIELGSLPNLERLELGGNRLTGTIPAELGSLSNLWWLELGGNQIGGNQLTGTIPSELGSLSNLQVLLLASNQLTGAIPSELGNLSNLQVLNLDVNRLTGPLPSSLTNLADLSEITFGDNAGLCAPTDAVFQTWLQGIDFVEGPNCGESTTPNPTPLSGHTTLDAGSYHTCALRENGEPVCWGSDEDGQSTPPDGKLKSISAGYNHTCGLSENGDAICWGDDRFGQSTPPGGKFKTISAGHAHTCALRDDGEAVCWGGNHFGRATPPGGKFETISAGGGHDCGLRDDGSPVCWGWDIDGQSTLPTGKLKSISAGDRHTCGLRENGEAVCWGLDEDGQSTPPDGRFESISAGWVHTCGLRDDGEAVCWGDNRNGWLNPPLDARFVSISAGADLESPHTCGLRVDGVIVCWGDDRFGRSTPPTDDECATTLTGDGSVEGNWNSACVSDIPSPSDDGDRYAHYYTFELTERSEVTIALSSDSIRDGDTYLYLRRGENQKEGGAYIENDDHGDDSNNDFDLPRRASGITATLQPGRYTLEATTYYSEESGDFTLTVSGIGAATQPPTQPPESPFTLVVEDFPTHAEVGQPITLTVRLHDVQQAGEHGGISVSFPSLTTDANDYVDDNLYSSTVADVERVSYTSGLSRVTFYKPGEDSIYHSNNNRQFTARDLLVESDDPSWSEGDDRTLTLRITPNQEGEFPILVRGWICADEYEDCSRQPISSDTPDQQGWDAYRMIVGVSAPSDDPDSGDDDECATAYTGDDTVDGEWVSDCDSENLEGRFAHYYTFTLDQQSEVTIKLESSEDTYLFLLRGAGRDGAKLCENDDYGSRVAGDQCDIIDFALDSTRDSGIVANLDAGDYTIEATTYNANTTGNFTLTVSGIDGGTQPPITPIQTFTLEREVSETSVEVGESFTLRVQLHDVQGSGEHGGVSVSFPSLTTDANDHVDDNLYSSTVADVERVSYTSGLSQVTFYKPGEDSIYHSNNNRQFTARDLLVESDDPSWSEGDDRTLTLRITPNQEGEFPILVRGWICADEYEDCSRQPFSSNTPDQQGWPAEEVVVNVLPYTEPPALEAPKLDAKILSCGVGDKDSIYAQPGRESGLAPEYETSPL